MPLFRSGAEGGDLAEPLQVEIGLTGNYSTRGFTLSTKQFDEMIANHKASGVDPAVDREHESWFSMSAQPALGWVKGLSVQPAESDKRRSALVAEVHLNDLGQAAIKNGHFRYVSMGFDKAGKNRQSGEPIGAVLDHLALVKNPFIQGMRPLSLALSTSLGRMVEGEDTMELLSTKLRTMLGLSADATEEQIIAAFDAAQKKNADLLTAAQKTADEQKRVNERVTAEIERLSKDAEERATAEWLSTVKAAVADFRLTPAEATEHEKLTGAERKIAEKLLALRQPHKPAGEVVAIGAKNGDAATQQLAKQEQALSAYKAAHPGLDENAALLGCMNENPKLFGEEV